MVRARWSFVAHVAPCVLAVACGGESIRRGSGRDAGSGGDGGTGALGSSTGGQPTSTGGATSGSGGDATNGGSAGKAGASHGLPTDFDTNPEPDAAVTYMIDPAHSGAQLARDIPPPLELEWSVRQDGEVSYPLIVGGYVFYAANRADRHATPSINAVDVRTGELLWNFSSDPGTFSSPAHLAYDRGSLFVADTAGHVIALDALTGRVLWSVALDADLPISIAASVPVAVGGGVFVTVSAADGIQLYALNGQYGSVAYRVSALQGYPTFGDGWIFTTSGCYETHGVDARTGDAKAHYQGECGGSGGERSAFWGGYVFTADGAGDDAVGVIDARFGLFYTELKSPGIAWPMTFGTMPLAIDTLDVPASDTPGGLVGYDSSLTTQKLLVPITEGGWPVLPAIVTTAHVYVLVAEDAAGPATLLALDPLLGKVTWSGTTQQVPEDPDYFKTGFGPLPGMAAGNGYVAIGWNRTIAAFGPAAEH